MYRGEGDGAEPLYGVGASKQNDRPTENITFLQLCFLQTNNRGEEKEQLGSSAATSSPPLTTTSPQPIPLPHLTRRNSLCYNQISHQRAMIVLEMVQTVRNFTIWI